MSESKARIYEVRVKGHLDERRLKRFEEFEATLLPNGEMLLVGPILDQAALYGLLNRLSDMGLPLLQVGCREDATEA